MFDFKNLLDVVMQSGMAGSGNQRMRHALGDSGLGGAGGLLSDLLGGGSAAGGGLTQMAGSMLGGGGTGRGGLAAGGLGALAGALLGGGSMKGALGGGVMALLGSMAVSALGNMNRPVQDTDVGSLPLGLREPQSPEEESKLQDQAKLVLRGMINAAKSDGQIGPAEIQRILGKLDELGADAEARRFVLEEMGKPANLEDLLEEVGSPEIGAQMYAASLLSIEVDTPAEKNYLQRLARGTGLDEAAVSRIHQMMGVSYPV